MPVLFRDTVTRQPQYLAGIEWGNPITSGLCLALLPHSIKNLTNIAANATLTGTPTPSKKAVADNARSKGAIAWSGFNTGGINWSPPSGLTEATIAQVQVNDSATPNSPWDTSAGDYDYITFSNNLCYFGAFGATRYISGVAVPGGVSSLQTPYVLLARGASTANSHAVYKDGVLIGSGNPTFNIKSTLTFGRSGGNTFGTNSGILLDAFWRRALATSEIASFSDNPWQIFQPPARKLWLMGAASGGTDYPVTRTESADASDTASLTIIYAATAAEIAEATSAHAAAMAAAASIAETGAATSTQAGALTAFVSIAETGAATDSSSTAGLYGVTVAEASDAADVASAIRALFGTASETGAATDTSSASLPGLYSVTVVEAANAEDEAAQAMSALVVIAEALAAADVANWVGAVIYTRAPRGGGYPATVQTTERYGTTNTKRPAMTNTRR